MASTSPGQSGRVAAGREAGRWRASAPVGVVDPAPASHPAPCLGVPLDIPTPATLGTGEAIPHPRAHGALLGRGRRSLSHERKGSAERAEARRRLARRHARVAAIRRDAAHNAPAALNRRFARIGVEDLNVRGMARDRPLARSAMDGAFGEFRRQLACKARRTGAPVVVADRFRPSGATRPRCGAAEAELAASQRIFRCDGADTRPTATHMRHTTRSAWPRAPR